MAPRGGRGWEGARKPAISAGHKRHPKTYDCLLEAAMDRAE